MQWIVILLEGVIYASVEALESIGIILTPITTQESVLTVNGTERINGATIRCQAVATTIICPSEDVQVIFNGMYLASE